MNSKGLCHVVCIKGECWGAWVAQLVESPALDTGSGLDLMFVSWVPCLVPCWALSLLKNKIKEKQNVGTYLVVFLGGKQD